MIMTCYGSGLCVHITMHALVANAISNPWTASKSDCATESIVTLLFNDGFQKCKNPVKADEILFEKLYYLCHIK